MTKRTKINFEIINNDKYSIISPKKVHESNQRIKKRMKEFIKKIKMKYFCSHKWKNVDDSPYYFHKKCDKCDAEKGIKNIKFK